MKNKWKLFATLPVVSVMVMMGCYDDIDLTYKGNIDLNQLGLKQAVDIWDGMQCNVVTDLEQPSDANEDIETFVYNFSMSLIGGLSSGFVLAVFMANAGGAWDNAKKYVEEGNFGGKGGEVHRATVVGDTVGDPFKDTSGPSLNILIKLMSMVAIVMAGLTVAWSLL